MEGFSRILAAQQYNIMLNHSVTKSSVLQMTTSDCHADNVCKNNQCWNLFNSHPLIYLEWLGPFQELSYCSTAPKGRSTKPDWDNVLTYHLIVSDFWLNRLPSGLPIAMNRRAPLSVIFSPYSIGSWHLTEFALHTRIKGNPVWESNFPITAEASLTTVLWIWTASFLRKITI